MKTFAIIAAVAYFVTLWSGSVEAADPDQHEQCQFWAESGECDSVSQKSKDGNLIRCKIYWNTTPNNE